MLAVVSFFGKGSGQRAGWLTKRAPDAGDSGENPKQFSTPYHFSSWTASPSPAPARVTQTVSPPAQNYLEI